ncbi:MAG: hypothetical protein LBK23_07570 [Oscillospiraceae bacterium]|jgi:hypothetical protein|nr:hypothetical protein [Oscillospiraceae bacterium]
MFTSEIIKQLKQLNISKDPEKTKVRIAGLWKNAPKPQRAEILDLSGVALATVQRAYKIGNVSAKLVVPLAQVLNVNPRFITGESDSADECTEAALRELLEERGYHRLLRAYDALERNRIRREKRETVKPAELPDASPDEYETPAPRPVAITEEDKPCDEPCCAEKDAGECCSLDSATAATAALAESLSEEDMTLLLKALLLRAKAGGKYAETAAKLRLLLIS